MMCKDITIMQEIPTNHMQHTKILLIKENNTKDNFYGVVINLITLVLLVF